MTAWRVRAWLEASALWGEIQGSGFSSDKNNSSSSCNLVVGESSGSSGGYVGGGDGSGVGDDSGGGGCGGWGSSSSSGGVSVGPLAAAKAEMAPAMMQALEDTRRRIAHCLARLQSADPALYDLAFISAGDPGEIEAAAAAIDLDHDLPHGWEAHETEEEGLIYYHNLVSGQTQWELPDQDAAVSAGWRLFQADDGEWFYHNPYNGDGVWYPELPSYTAEPDSLDALRRDAAAHS
eukprot:TRINITY_DN11097_c1_g1_i5.p1 TRINITY_DN11097_c1_g1~~TRINITY_DN11097_c1_g1_i5.p1  ORF type:complete len:243 (+),score=75.54 TRINITY_DN11097_c1_g1_i5:25-729(+)